MVARRLQSWTVLLRGDPRPADKGNDVPVMTPEEALKRHQRRWRLTLATVIIVLVSLTVWAIELITRAK